MKSLFFAFLTVGCIPFAFAGSAFDPPNPRYLVTCEPVNGASVVTLVQVELMASGALSTRIAFSFEDDIEIHRATESRTDTNWLRLVKAEASAAHERVVDFDIPHPRQKSELKAEWGSLFLKNGVGGVYNVALICQKAKF